MWAFPWKQTFRSWVVAHPQGHAYRRPSVTELGIPSDAIGLRSLGPAPRTRPVPMARRRQDLTEPGGVQKVMTVVQWAADLIPESTRRRLHSALQTEVMRGVGPTEMLACWSSPMPAAGDRDRV